MIPPETVILEEGIEVQQTKSYGVGIDTHSKFIQVSVYVKRDMKFFEDRREFSTRWNDLILAKQWILKVIETCSDPVPDLTEAPFHYCIGTLFCKHHALSLRPLERASWISSNHFCSAGLSCIESSNLRANYYRFGVIIPCR